MKQETNELLQLKDRLAELRQELHELYIDAAKNGKAIDKAAQELAAIQEEIHAGKNGTK